MTSALCKTQRTVRCAEAPEWVDNAHGDQADGFAWWVDYLTQRTESIAVFTPDR